MINPLMKHGCRPLALAATAVVAAGIVGLPRQADAAVWVGFGFPLFVPPPVYYPPPPAYYPPPSYYPPPYYAPPPYQPPVNYNPPPQYSPSGQACVAGPSVCPMEHPVATGAACYCTTPGGRVWGRAT
jgi:hypothetical protein